MQFWNIVNDSYRINALYINQNDVLNKVKFEKVHSFLRIWYKLVLHFTGKLCCKIVILLLACTVYVSTVRRLKFTQIMNWCKPLFKQVCFPPPRLSQEKIFLQKIGPWCYEKPLQPYGMIILPLFRLCLERLCTQVIYLHFFHIYELCFDVI